MIAPDLVHCVGPTGGSDPAHSCGRYVESGKAWDAGWRVNQDGPGLICPNCLRARTKARARAQLLGGVRRSIHDMSPEERTAAAEVLGTDLVKAVDEGWR